MTEAERYLEERLKRAAAVKSGIPAAGGNGAISPIVGETRLETATSVQPAAPTPDVQVGRGSGDGGGKVWGVVMGVFAILMTMLWMAVFKGGCR